MSCLRTSSPGSSGVINFLNWVRQSSLLLLCGVALSSCGPVADYLGSSPSETSSSKESAAQPEDTTAAAETEESGPIAPLTSPTTVAPPGGEERPPKLGRSGREQTAENMPPLQPRGVDLQELFAKKLRSDNDRFDRVENAVIELRQDFDSVLPSILRLVAVEHDMQELMKQLDALLQNEPPSQQGLPPIAARAAPVEPVQMAAVLPPPEPPAKAQVPPPVQAKPPPAALAGILPARPLQVPQQAPPEPKAQPPPSEKPPPVAKENAAPEKNQTAAAGGSPGAINVTRVRIGEHPDKTRIVLDLSGPTPFRFDVDDEENLLTIELPDAGWTGQKEWTSGNAPLLASWTMLPSDNGQGSRMIVQLKQAATVVYNAAIPPGGGDPDRIVIDLRRK